MNAVIQNVLKLQELEFGEVTGESVESQIAELRGKIPQPILGHYDRLRVRDKKGVAAVRNNVCTGCHMRVPIGQVTVLMRGEDIQVCETCGRYLYMAEPDPVPEAAQVEQAGGESGKPKRAAKPRRKKKSPEILTVL
jgi:predicted  nucleic acid-binding Zn-ribbon protein